jgi:hypothetical protein
MSSLQSSKNTRITNFVKIRPVEAEFFLADGQRGRQTDRHDGANSRFSKFCKTRLKLNRFKSFAGSVGELRDKCQKLRSREKRTERIKIALSIECYESAI